VKIFPSDFGHPFLPRPWLDALGAPRHIQQGQVIAVAENRAQLAELLASVRVPHLAGSLRLRRGPQSTPNQALIDAGVIDPDVPGLYAYERPVRDCPVIRVTPEGCAVVAWFRLPDGTRSLTVETAKP
jgi:hypothetical protein